MQNANIFSQPRLGALLLVASLLATGCSRTTTKSGIPTALKNSPLLQAAGVTHDLTIGPQAGREAQGTSTSETDLHLTITVGAGTPGQFMAKYREEVRQRIEQLGGVIHGRQLTGTDADVVAFGYEYHWQDQEGIVRVRTVRLPDGSLDFWQLCYEHRR